MPTVGLKTDLPMFRNDLADEIRSMLGPCDITDGEGDITIVHKHTVSEDKYTEVCMTPYSTTALGPLSHLSHVNEDGMLTVTYDIKKGNGLPLDEKRRLKRAAKTSIFLLLGSICEKLPPWGSLTGIRPTRLYYEAIENGLTDEQAIEELKTRYFVSQEKAALLSEIVKTQRTYLEKDPKAFDLYIGIPFCRSRCSYCSFAAGEIGDGDRVEPYIQALLREMELCAYKVKEQGLFLRAAYIGGGTPTAISSAQLKRIIRKAKELYPGAAEWTVEAGRPDTIDIEKLTMLRDESIDRICVNPQTFHDDTLKLIGRAHTSEETINAFKLARSLGFRHINMDLIAALPGESERDFELSLMKTIELDPESITVHALAIKHSSKLNEQRYVLTPAETAQRMVDNARRTLNDYGYLPYYLYRQKYMAGNLENVGYAKEGNACLYNIDNMEETTSVLAFGAGSITKWFFPGREDGGRSIRIERAPNVRNIDEYISRYREMAERKLNLICK